MEAQPGPFLLGSSSFNGGSCADQELQTDMGNVMEGLGHIGAAMAQGALCAALGNNDLQEMES